jgi:uncharacterized membrane protein YhaH (DUF805 family)
MPISHMLFGFTGRLPRLPYFLCTLAFFGVTLAVVILLTAANIAFASVGAVVFTIVVGLAYAVGGVWAGFALMIKRLHDLGLSGVHVIWIMLLGAAASAISDIEPVTGILLSCASIGVQLWLYFAPGVGQSNQYGPVPGLSPLPA